MAERIFDLGVGETEYQLQTKANIIYFFNYSDNSVYASSRSGASDTKYEAYANAKRWGWIARPTAMEKIFFYAAGAAQLIIIEEMGKDPLYAMGQQGLEQLVQVTSLPALAAGSNEVGKFRLIDEAGNEALITAEGLLRVDAQGVTLTASNVGISQTTPGVSNGVEVVAELPAGTKNIGDVDIASIAAGQNVKPASTPDISILRLQLANTEYTFTLPDNCKKFTLKSRTLESDLRLAYATGIVATPAADGEYTTINAGLVKSEENVLLSGRVLYLACGTADTYLEIETWV